MDRWGVLRRFGQVNAPAAAVEAAQEPNREESALSQPLPSPAELLPNGVSTVPPNPVIRPPPPLELQPEQRGNMAADEDAPVAWISRKSEIPPSAVVRPRVHSEGDYLGISYRPRFGKVLTRYGDSKVLFADKVLKFTSTGKAKQRGLVITNSAVYLFDPETDALKRRIVLKAVNRLCMSELTDKFLAFIVSSEYDCLLASTRKKEIAQVVAEATRDVSGGEMEVDIAFSNSFEYRPSVQVVKEVVFEELEGEIKTRILRKQAGQR